MQEDPVRGGKRRANGTLQEGKSFLQEEGAMGLKVSR